jgi:hypothetical protein
MAVEGPRLDAPPDGPALVVVDPALVAYLANRAELSTAPYIRLNMGTGSLLEAPDRVEHCNSAVAAAGFKARPRKEGFEHTVETRKQERACRWLHRAECYSAIRTVYLPSNS